MTFACSLTFPYRVKYAVFSLPLVMFSILVFYALRYTLLFIRL